MGARGAVVAATASAALLAGCGSSAPAPANPPTAPAPGVSAPPSGAPPANQVRVAISAFSWQDNDPPNSAQINSPVVHQMAGGQGTYADPITAGGSGSYPPGTRFYLPSLERYVVIEDTGAPPPPPGTQAALSVWIDGRGAVQAATDACEDQVTGNGVATAEVNPPPGRPVVARPIFANNTCNLPTD
jgi:hypothetical protein